MLEPDNRSEGEVTSSLPGRLWLPSKLISINGFVSVRSEISVWCSNLIEPQPWGGGPVHEAKCGSLSPRTQPYEMSIHLGAAVRSLVPVHLQLWSLSGAGITAALRWRVPFLTVHATPAEALVLREVSYRKYTWVRHTCQRCEVLPGKGVCAAGFPFGMWLLTPPFIQANWVDGSCLPHCLLTKKQRVLSFHL